MLQKQVHFNFSVIYATATLSRQILCTVLYDSAGVTDVALVKTDLKEQQNCFFLSAAHMYCISNDTFLCKIYATKAKNKS